jgi:putative phosphoesterase
MKIIAIADTHINHRYSKLPSDLLALIKEADMILHAGDFVAKRAFDELSEMCELEAVQGNMDETELKRLLPERRVIVIEGIKIGIIHEASLSLQDTIGARYMAKEMAVDLLVFGHIHKPVIEKSDVIIACPGSPTFPRLTEPSVIEFDIENRKISGKIITLEGTRCGALESARSFQN